MNLLDDSYLIGNELGICLVGDEPSNSSCPLRTSHEGDSCPVGDKTSGGSYPTGDDPRGCLEADSCVIILEWGYSFSKHTDRGLRVKGALNYGVGLTMT